MVRRNTPQSQHEILAATLLVMRKFGANGATTSRIAAEANCSKETLYRWFGDRQGLLASLARAQMENAIGTLTHVTNQEGSGREALVQFGATLLDLLTGEPAILIHRVAIGEGGQLARLVLENHKQTIAAIGIEILCEVRSAGVIKFDNSDEAYDLFCALVLNNRQMDCLLGDANGRPPGNDMFDIAEQAVDRFLLIYSPLEN